MVDFKNLKSGSDIKIKITDDHSDNIISAIIGEVEWCLSRKPIAVNLEIKDSTDLIKWPKNSNILLGFDLEEGKPYKFLLKCPTKIQPNKIVHCNAKIQFILN